VIILDTNVISETQKKVPDVGVMAWLNAQDPTNLFLTSITVGELMFGVFSLKPGARFERLSNAVTAIVEERFRERVLPYDAVAARHYGMRVGELRRRGITIGHADGQIAAIAIANNEATIATRDKNPFQAMRLDVINPWEFDSAADS